MANTALDNDLAVDVPELMAELGKDATFTIPASNSYNPRDGVRDLGSETDFTWKVTPPVQTNQYVDNDLRQEAIWRAFISATSITFTPTQGFTMTLDSKTWQIHDVTTIYSGELKVGYKLFLRA